MVRIKNAVTKEGIGAVMIDGYAPQPEEFEELPWAEMWREEGLDYSEWLNRIRPHQRNIRNHYSESAFLTAYRNAIRAMMRGFCPSKKDRGITPRFLQPSYPEPICYYQGFTIDRTSGSIERPDPRGVISKSVWKTQLPILQREYRNDEQNRRVHYIQNVIMYPHCSTSKCQGIDECCVKWMKTLHFHEKPDDQYLDLKDFAGAWSNLLADMTQAKPGRRFRFYEELRLS